MSSNSLFFRWQSSKSAADYGAYLDALVAEGHLAAERVALAGGLFHAGARASSVAPVRFSEGYRGRITRALASLPHRQIVEFAAECAERTLPNWMAFAPRDPRIAQSISAVRGWLEQKVGPEVLESAIDTADACAQMALDALGTKVAPEITRALSAATAAANAARCAETTNDMNIAATCAGGAAKPCADSSDDYLLELHRQIDQVCLLLLRPTQSP